MKAITITQPGGPEVLQLSERAVPTPGPGQVLIKVAAAGVNRVDVYQRQGHYPAPADAPPDIPGLEVAGEISMVGEDVTRWKMGDRVCALISGGGYAGHVLAAGINCLPIPGGLSFAEAAGLPETYFTVWSNVFNRCRLQPGESLLVHGGSSGIGVTAIQLLTAMGHPVYATAGSPEKCRFCEALGAVKAINYKTEKFDEVIGRETGGNGVDVILEMVGAPYMTANLAALATDGRMVYINTMMGKMAEVDLSVIIRKRLTITGSTLRVRDYAFKAAIAKDLEAHVWPLLAEGKIKPIIYKTFPAEQAADAHTLMESSGHMGKLVLLF